MDTENSSERNICDEYIKKYNLCIKEYGFNKAKCDYYREMTYFFNCFNNFFEIYKPFE